MSAGFDGPDDRTAALPRGARWWFVRLGILLAGLLVALFAVEILMRRLSPHPRYEFAQVPDAKVGHLTQPGFRGRATNMFGEYDTGIRINQEGFRDSDHPVQKPAGTIRVAFLGDSFTFAEQVEEPDCFVRRTWMALNGARMADSPDRVECLNFGVGGYDLQQYVLCYETFVRKYRPDMVVVMVYVDNDLLGNAFYLMEKGFGRPYFRLVNGALERVPTDETRLKENYEEIRRRLHVRWYHHLHSYNAYKLFFWKIRQAQRLREGRKQPPPLPELWQKEGCRNYRYYAVGTDDPVVKEADILTRLLLKRLETEVKDDGGRLMVAMLPAPENLWPERWPERVKLLPGLEGMTMDFDRPFRQIRASLPGIDADGGILDTRPALREAALHNPVFFPRDSHYNRNGQEAVAQALTRWLEPIVSPPAGSSSPVVR